VVKMKMSESHRHENLHPESRMRMAAAQQRRRKREKEERMKKAALALVLVAVLLLTGCSTEFTRAGVLVFSTNGHGSGIAIGPHTVLTARHVAVEPNLAVRDDLGVVHKITATIYADDGIDAALLTVEGVLPSIMSISLEPLVKGDQVCLIGAPGDPNMINSLMTGEVVNINQCSRYADGDVTRNMDVLGIHIFPGVSGGGIIHDGCVVGIMVGGRGGIYGLALPTECFRDLLIGIKP
jgi:preprotein translocase subunit Sec61beta